VEAISTTLTWEELERERKMCPLETTESWLLLQRIRNECGKDNQEVNQGPVFIIIIIIIIITIIHIPHFTADEIVLHKAQVLLTKTIKSNL